MLPRILACLLALTLLFYTTPAAAQTSTPPPPGPVYIVQSGDNLSDISIRFNTSVADIMAVS